MGVFETPPFDAGHARGGPRAGGSDGEGGDHRGGRGRLRRGRRRTRGQAHPRLHRRRRVTGVPRREAAPRRRRPRRRVRTPAVRRQLEDAPRPGGRAGVPATPFSPRTPHDRTGRSGSFPPPSRWRRSPDGLRGRDDLLAGAQDVHWEPKGAFTGAISVPLAAQAGAGRRWSDTRNGGTCSARPMRRPAGRWRRCWTAGLVPMLCVGETLAEREEGATLAGRAAPAAVPRSQGRTATGSIVW